MKIDMTTPTPTVEATDLAKAFGIAPSEVIALMREGAITSRFETGVDTDAGSFRLTFWHKTRRVRFTCDEAGTVLKTSRTTVKPKA
jgi:hypothetical protein